MYNKKVELQFSHQEKKMDVNQLAVNTIRVLSAEAIEKAKSGHPGLPLGSAPIAYTLFSRHLKFDPKAPDRCFSIPY